MRILVATNGSSDASETVAWLAHFPAPTDAAVEVVSAVRDPLIDGIGPVERLLLGSVSESVLCHAACPVLIVRPRG